MEQLHAYWRMEYIEAPRYPATMRHPFTELPALGDDRTALIVHRSALSYLILNRFPYNPGHLLICPYRHVPLYVDLTDEETTEFTAMTKTALAALTRTSAPMGFNIGMNQGRVAGAGVAAHLHQHVVPRWGGDSNFLPIIGQTKALPLLLEDVRTRLAEVWPA